MLQVIQTKVERNTKGKLLGVRNSMLNDMSLDMKVFTHSNSVNFYNGIKENILNRELYVSILFQPKGTELNDKEGNTITTTDMWSPVVIFMTKEQVEANKERGLLTWTVNKHLGNIVVVPLVSGSTNSFASLYNPQLVDFKENLVDEEGLTIMTDGVPEYKMTTRVNSLAFTLIDELDVTDSGIVYENAYLLELIAEVEPTPSIIRTK